MSIREAAVQGDEALDEDIVAATLPREDYQNIIVLFSAEQLMTVADRWDGADDLAAMASSVMGYMAVTDYDAGRHGLSKVAAVGAMQGYGPLMYELMMTHCYPTMLRPSDDLNEHSKTVWTKFLRRPDIKKVWVGDMTAPDAVKTILNDYCYLKINGSFDPDMSSNPVLSMFSQAYPDQTQLPFSVLKSSNPACKKDHRTGCQGKPSQTRSVDGVHHQEQALRRHD